MTFAERTALLRAADVLLSLAERRAPALAPVWRAARRHHDAACFVHLLALARAEGLVPSQRCAPAN